MKQKVILQVIGGLNRGGAETMLMNIYRKIDKKEFKFVFLTYTENMDVQDYEKEIINNGDTIIKININCVKNPVLFYKKLNEIMIKDKYDCVHSHTLFNSGIVILVAKKNNIPIRLTHSHSSGTMNKSNFVNFIYMYFSRFLINKFSTHLLACNESSGKYLFRNFKNGIIIKNGIDLDKFNSSCLIDYTIDPCLGNNKILKLAAISSFYKVKNHIFMIEIAKRLKSQGVKFVLYFAGRGPLEAELKNIVEENDLIDVIKFLGVIENVNSFLPALDIILMPSFYEGIPVSLIEAQASGVPCIISNKISHDVDLGLKLVKFLDIDSNYNEWIDCILNTDKNNVKNEDDVIKSQLKKGGYSIEENIKIISSLYRGEFNE